VGLRKECEATVTVRAPADAVWAVVSDVTRTGEWSGECKGCEWVGPVTEARPGAQFRGRNHRRGLRWSRRNEVDVADASQELAWHTVMSAIFRDSTEWRIVLAPTADGQGTDVTESFRITHISRPLDWLFGLAMPPHRDRSADLAADLERLKAVVERASTLEASGG
jgi:hypothetical protein